MMESTSNNNQNKKTQLEDVAAALGLSKSTVSRAISGKGRISSETRERVFECIKEMGYRPNIIAKSLSENKTYNIGVVIPVTSDEMGAPFFQTCLLGIVKECAVRDYDAVVISAEKRDLTQLIRVVENRKVDGVIITRPLSDNSMEKLLKSYDIPFVVIGKSMMENVVSADNNHTEGCEELTKYLLSSNPHDKVALLLSNMSHMVNKSRLEGFEKAFEAIGEKPAADMVYTGLESSLMFEKAVITLMKNDPRCIICGDDMLCMKLLSQLKSLGKSIPEDIRVASFYDNAYLDNFTPPITSLIFDAGELGAEAASMLIDSINGGEKCENVVLGFQMLIRKSTM